MNARLGLLFTFVSLIVSAPRPAAAAVVAAPGYAVRSIATPGAVQGGVVVQGGVILVGQGTFGTGLESVVRLGGGTPVTIATGFNSLGGLALDAAGTLYVTDNAGERVDATTGDTLFAVPSALTRPVALAAAGSEVVPKGTIPFASSVLVAPDGAILVTDAVGPGAGRVVRVKDGVATSLITALDYAAGLALTAGGTLLVGNVDGSFAGAVLKYDLAGVAGGALATGLSGEFGHVLDADGNLLVTGGFQSVSPFTSTVVAIAPGGAVTERAHGFSFSTGIGFNPLRNEALVLDSAGSEITAICRDQDADGACDPCTAGVVARKAVVRIGRLGSPPGDDTFSASGDMTFPFPFAPALDPLANGARIVLESASGTLIDAILPGGAFTRASKTGWKVGRGKNSWSYHNPSGIAGVTTVVVRKAVKTPGLVHVAATGRHGSWAVTAGDLPLAATMVLAGSGECGAATFPGPSPAPACVFKRKGKVLVCK